MTPYFGTGASRFIYFVCMCCARVPRDEGGRRVRRGEGTQKGLVRNDSSARWGRRTGIFAYRVRTPPVSRCIQIVFFPPPPPKDNFRSIFDFHSTIEDELGKTTGIASRGRVFSPAPYIAVKDIRKIMKTFETHALRLKKYFISRGRVLQFFRIEIKQSRWLVLKF